MSRMSDHVADDASLDSEDDEDDDDSSSSPSDTTSSSNLTGGAGGAGDAGPGTSGSSGGPYSALTRSLGASPRGEGLGLGGRSFHQQQLSSDSDGLSSRDSPPKRPRDTYSHNLAQYDSSDDGEIEFG